MKVTRRYRKKSILNLTPMIDIVFLLIIFFMVSSTLVKTRGMDVKLPRSASSDAETKNLIVISLTEREQIYVNDQKTTLTTLGRDLKKLQVELDQEVVIIKGDKSSSYNKMIQIMDIAKIAGMKKISLATTGK